MERGDSSDPVLTLKQYALGKERLEAEYGVELGGAVRDHWLQQP